ncbi:MAG: hypothetical protein M3O22_01715 [Pseudomonadota bacterium]|nr:hypothetical protein [Pseudomonadota bacterium]
MTKRGKVLLAVLVIVAAAVNAVAIINYDKPWSFWHQHWSIFSSVMQGKEAQIPETGFNRLLVQQTQRLLCKAELMDQVDSGDRAMIQAVTDYCTCEADALMSIFSWEKIQSLEYDQILQKELRERVRTTCALPEGLEFPTETGDDTGPVETPPHHEQDGHDEPEHL